MRRVRNPRYALEFLERKLSPSAMMSVTATAADYSVYGTPKATGEPPTSPDLPGEDPPPTSPQPPIPTGPVGPA